LELQHNLGRRFFLVVVRMIIREARENIERQDREEDGEWSDELEN